MEYEHLPPLLPVGASSPEPPPLPAVSPPDVPDEDELDDEPDGADAPDDAGDAPDDDDDSESDDAESTEKDDVKALKKKIAELEERAAAAEDYERQYAEQQRAAQQANAEQYWENAYLEAENWFRTRQQAIYAEADDAIAPVAYVQQQMDILSKQWTGWLRDFHALREQAAWQFAMQQALPNYAGQVADHYGLPRDAVPELLTYPHELIPREAQRMKRERDERAKERRKATQAERKRQREQVYGNAVFPGSGGPVPKDKVEMGGDDHYLSIPWTRVTR